mgnify:CR=1 FL=1
MIILKKELNYKDLANGQIRLMIKFLSGALFGIIVSIYFQEDITNIVNNLDKIINYIVN